MEDPRSGIGSPAASPTRAAAAAAEATATAKASETAAASTAESTPTEATAAPPAASVTTTSRQDDRQRDATASSTAHGAEHDEHDEQDHEERDGRHLAATPSPRDFLLHARRRRRRRVECEAELACEFTADARGEVLQRRAVFALLEVRRRLPADRCGVGVGDEAFGALPRGDEAGAVAGGVGLLRHQEDDN